MHERETTPTNGQLDTDMLTDEELIEVGYEPRFTELSEVNTPTPEPEQKCEFCGREVKNAVHSFKRHGVEFISDDEVAHEGCARSQYENVKQVMQKVMGD